MGFDAGQEVPPLDWDFTKYAGEDAKGTTPEPSNKAITTFVSQFRSLKEAVYRTISARVLAEQGRLKDQTDEERQADYDRWAAMSWQQGLEVLELEVAKEGTVSESEDLARQMAESAAKLCSDCPNVEQILALPGRLRSAYFGWLVGQVSDPESWAAGTKGSQVLLPGG